MSEYDKGFEAGWNDRKSGRARFAFTIEGVTEEWREGFRRAFRTPRYACLTSKCAAGECKI
jgi:hypothetical protein